VSPPEFVFRKHLTVEAVEDGNVAVTVVLPPELVRDYCSFLESLASFFHSASHKGSWALSRSRAASRVDSDNKSLAEYRARLVAAFDTYTARGFERKAAIKQIAADLRAESHPWCCPDMVRSQLVAGGRGGRPGRPRRGVK